MTTLNNIYIKNNLKNHLIRSSPALQF